MVAKEESDTKNFGGGWHSDVTYLEEPAMGSILADTQIRRQNVMTIVPSEQANREVDHPVVRTHPETGRKCLYVNPAFTVRFKDMTEQESAPLLRFLYDHCRREEFTCRFRWKTNSIAFWDNRCVQHFAPNDYDGQRRVMHRVTVNGDRPV